MTQIVWVRPTGPAPRPGTRLRVQLEQDVHGRPFHTVGYAEIHVGGQALLKLADSECGRLAAELVKEDMIDCLFWGSKPTLRLR